jgi:P-type Cu+ transporter
MKMKTEEKMPQGFHEDTQPEWVVDLVCGMELELKTVTLSSTHNGQRYYFCGESCKTHFDNNPAKYDGQ